MPISSSLINHMLFEHPLLTSISPKYLVLLQKFFRVRDFKTGDLILREGQTSNTAFLIRSGNFQVSAYSEQRQMVKNEDKAKRLGLATKFTFSLAPPPKSSNAFQTMNSLTYGGTLEKISSPDLRLPPKHVFLAMLEHEDLIFGESSCLNNYPCPYTVVALSDDCSVIEIRRNIVQILLRDRASRELLEEIYFKRGLERDLRKNEYLTVLADTAGELKKIIKDLKDKVSLVKVRPGQTIARMETKAEFHDFIRLGFVRVERKARNGELFTERYLGLGKFFGEAAIISSLTSSEGIKSPYDLLKPELSKVVDRFGIGCHHATYTAMDHVELLRIPQAAIQEIYLKYPLAAQEMRRILNHLLKEEYRVFLQPPASESRNLKKFMDQGLANATNLLVIDLNKCTRCDECTKACAQAHDGQTRLIREGLRLSNYLITSSCRSCMDPYCMLGCPVDAINRNVNYKLKDKNGNWNAIELDEIPLEAKPGDVLSDISMRIQGHCIGCGLCATQCPYGNINMQPMPKQESSPLTSDENGKVILRMQATICDLCHETTSKTPSCVYACPHDAAHRVSGEKLLSMVD